VAQAGAGSKAACEVAVRSDVNGFEAEPVREQQEFGSQLFGNLAGVCTWLEPGGAHV
jgi:hypothetical protein